MSILPIVTYNDPVLRKRAEPVESDSQELQQLIDDMFETMYNGQGVGLAAPQIGRSIRLFVIDADAFTEDDEQAEDVGPLVFINPDVKPANQDTVLLDEGCLSIPGIRESVSRPEVIQVSYLDRNFKEQKRAFTGWVSRVIQHEFDHIDGILFIDYLGSFRKRMLKSRLNAIHAGEAEAAYPVASKEKTDSATA